MDKDYRKIIIKVDDDDDTDFIFIIENIVNGFILKLNVADINIVKIKNWFDHKWLNYSGKGIIHFEGTLNPERIAIDNFWKEKVTVPPFTPNRVLKDIYYNRIASDSHSLNNSLHKWQRSTDNQNNRIVTKSENGFFFWYSSNSLENQRGSIMAYYVNKNEVKTWYASIENISIWSITKTKGISKEILIGLSK